MTYINENWEITTKGEPDPVINLECYRLVLYHEMSDGEKIISLDPPIQRTLVMAPFTQKHVNKGAIIDLFERMKNQVANNLGG